MRYFAMLTALLTATAIAQEVPTPPARSASGAVPQLHCNAVQPLLPSAPFNDPAFKSAVVDAQVEFVPPGVVGAITIKKGSGYRELDEAVVDAMRKLTCKFDSPLTRTTPVQQRFEFNSTIDDSPRFPDSAKFCPPDGPKLPKLFAADNSYMMKPGWVTLRMRVRPGAVPVSDVRVVSEAGGPGHAREWLRLVRQWTGCTSNERDTQFEMRFNFGIQGAYHQPEKEGFGPHAFKQPRGAPLLPRGDYGAGVCPIRASLQLRQPEAPNVVLNLESGGAATVTQWLESLIPDREYMTPSASGNRVEFECRVNDSVVSFYEN